jgi:hypothetical protein
MSENVNILNPQKRDFITYRIIASLEIVAEDDVNEARP